MPRIVPQGAILEIVFEQLMANQRLLNYWHYKLNTQTGATTDGDAVTDLWAQQVLVGAAGVPALLKPQMAATWQLSQTRTQWIYPLRYTPVTYTNGQGVGTNLGDSMPPNVASTVTKRGLLAGKHAQGKISWGGMVSAHVINGFLSPDRVEMLIQVSDVLDTALDVSAIGGAISLVPIIFNKANPLDSEPIEETIVQSTSRVQRRRTVGVGI